MTKERNTNIEVFRYLLMVLICIWHLFVHGYSYNSMGADTHASELSLLGMCLSDYAVDAFILITGFYGLNFSYKRLVGLILHSSSAYWICAILCTVIGFENSNMGGVKYIALHIFPVSTHVWWFLTEYTILLIISPLINVAWAGFKDKEKLQVVIGLTFVNCIGYMMAAMGGNSLLNMLHLYLIGRLLFDHYDYFDRFSWKIYLLMFIAATVSFYCILIILSHYASQKICWFLMANNSFFVIMQAAMIVLCVLRIHARYNKILNTICSQCLFIYLLSEGIGAPYYNYLVYLNNYSPLCMFGFIILTTFIALFCGLVCSKLLGAIGKKLTSRLENLKT